MRLGLLSNPIFIILVSATLWPIVPHESIMTWIGVWGLVFIIRVYGYYQVKNFSAPGNAFEKWHGFVTVTTLLYALTWGGALFLVWPADSPAHQLVLIMPIVGMVAAGAAAYAPVMAIDRAFILGLTIPLIVRFVTVGTFGYIAVSIMAVIYTFVSLGIMKNLYYSGTEAFLTSFKNQELAETLRLRNADLEQALSSIKTLSGMLPICANCKKIRDDQGYYQQIEHYITEHSEAEFTHGICPDCAKELYPDISMSDN
ncbi:MAG: hypothetical protein IID15_09005 [Candidatus Marinimicrobia bacterium]|nr:hypothetical protein [Candidatus Neomarinimicrobiota bacterium]